MRNVTFNGKRVVAIGGTSGIGFAIATRVAAEGGQVIVASSTQEKIDNAVKRIDGDVKGVRLDVTDEAAIGGFFAETGEFDHLAYTAGEALLLKPLAELTSAEARAFFEVRYWGALLSVKYGAPRIRPGGSIVLSSGGVATRPAPGTSIAASTTGADEALVRALALELVPIRVNAVRPGPVATELWTGTVPNPEELLEAFAGQLPLKRVGTAEEVAAAYVYLMENGFTTGTVLTIDGGQALV
jgi:NAD(P)-dependent dehydrogenase (short-subunit alcohol dehydrogenase family)